MKLWPKLIIGWLAIVIIVNINIIRIALRNPDPVVASYQGPGR